MIGGHLCESEHTWCYSTISVYCAICGTEKGDNMVYPAFTVKDVWVVHQESEHGGRGQLIGIFSDADKADIAAVGRGAWWSNATPKKRKAVVESGHAYVIECQADLDLNLPAYELKVREKGLSKLTREEKMALGLEK